MSSFASQLTLNRRPRTRVLVGLPLLAALLGAMLGLAVRDDARGTAGRRAVAPPAQLVAAGDLRFVPPAGWTPVRRSPGIPGLEGARTSFLRNWSGDVAIALLPPANRSLLPAQLAAARAVPAPRPRVLRAGGVQAYHYMRVLGHGRLVEVYAAPTTRGTATVACAMTVYTPGVCDLVLPTLRLVRGSFLALNADAAFLAHLPMVVATLDAQRGRLRGRLVRASRADVAARIVDRLARAYATADRALQPVAAPRSAAAATVRLLGELRTGYAGLAGVLRTGDRAAFARAARVISGGEIRLARRLDRWESAVRAAG